LLDEEPRPQRCHFISFVSHRKETLKSFALTNSSFTRQRRLPIEHTIGHILQLVCDRGQNGYEICSQSYFDPLNEPGVKRPSLSSARAKVNYEAFVYLLSEANLESKNRRQDKWKGHYVRAIDGSWLTLPASDEMLKSYPRREKAKGYAHYPNGILVTAQNVITGQPVAALMCDYHGSERTQLALITEHFKEGDIALFDRGLGGYTVWQFLVDRGQHFIGRVNVVGSNVNREVEILIRSPRSSSVVTMQSPYGELKVRLIKAKKLDRNNDPIIFATSLLNVRKYPDKEILRLYEKRWDIETLYYRIKELLNLEKFHARTLNGVHQEIYANLFLLSMLARLVLEAARLKGLDLKKRAANFKNALEVFKRNLLWFIQAVVRKKLREKIYEKILAQIGAVICEKQAGRKNPRISMQPTSRWNQHRPLGKNRIAAKKLKNRKRRAH
jgi:hypothetical protein